MFTARVVFILLLTGATARRPPHSQVSASGFDAVEVEESGVSTQPTPTISVGAVEGPPALLPEPTSSSTATTVVQTLPVNSFQQTAHDQVSATGFEAAPTPPPEEQGSTTNKGHLFSNLPHSQSTVAINNPGSTLQAPVAPVGGGGHGPVPEPETTVLGNDMSLILGGPGTGPPEETPLQEAPKGAPIKTVEEPGPITAAPAATPAPAPVQTPAQELLPSRGIAHQPPGKEGDNAAKPITIPVQPALTIVKASAVITVGSSTITANSLSQFIVGTQTLARGGPAITHSGIVLSLPSSEAGVVFGPSTQVAQPVTPMPIDGKTQEVTPPLPVITVGGARITGNSASQYIINGQTLAAGKAPIIVSGQILSIASSGNAVVFGPSTQAFATPPLVLSTSLPTLTVDGSLITANSASDYVIAGQTIHPSGSAITLGGKVISLAPSATALVIGGSTQALTSELTSLTTGLPVLTVGSARITANAKGEYVLSGHTVRPGAHAVTIGGQLVSLAADDSFLVVGNSTETLHGVTKTGGTISRSMTQMTSPAKSTAVGFTEGEAPTMGGPASAESSKESMGSGIRSTLCALWVYACSNISLVLFLTIML
ncbi:MAG: hypothetical protein Q9223_006404 [Gallowayella weberi]